MGVTFLGQIAVVCVGGGAEVSSTRRQSPWVNLRWSIWLGAWNLTILSSQISLLNLHRDVSYSSTDHVILYNPIFTMGFLHLPPQTSQ